MTIAIDWLLENVHIIPKFELSVEDILEQAKQIEVKQLIKAYNAGYQDEAREIACKFVTDFNDVDYIVAPSGSCTGFIRSYYPHMLEHSKESNKGKQIVQRAFEFSEFLVDVLKVQLNNTQFPHKVTYHDACGAFRECGIKAQPRNLLNQIKWQRKNKQLSLR
jgi:L-lactate dehydrogenase complex protein LldE